MEEIILHMPEKVRKEVWSHLLPASFMAEEAAFMYVQQIPLNGSLIFSYLDWYPVPPEGFRTQSEYHFELTDETRAKVIKRAHDLNSTLVEFHSHDAKLPVQFSPTDFMGFKDFVPHVWWRLEGHPYIAVVVSETGFDGLSWIKSPDIPQRLDAISVEDNILKPTGLSFIRRKEYYGERSF